MIRTEQIWIRVSPELKQKIIALAQKEGRSMSGMIAKIIGDIFKEKK